MRFALAAPLLLFLAGCLGAAGPDAPLVLGSVPGPLALTADGGVEVEVPVDVVLVGFAPGTAAAVAAKLAPERIVQFASDDWIDVPPNASRPPHAPTFKDAFIPLPLTPTAVFRVAEAPASLHAELVEFADRRRVENASNHDANAVEDWLAARLPEAGFPIRPEAPPLVVLHLGEAPHAWRYAYPHGHLEPVRAFGERHPLLVFDVSAAEDPYVTGRNPAADAAYLAVVGGTLEPVKAYDRPLAAGGEATVAALAELAVDAARFRLLHGSAVPPSLKPCHAVTLVLAARTTAASEHLPGFAKGEALVDLPALDAGWEMLTGPGTVEIDLKLVRLPADDPALDALTRPGFGAVGGVRGGYDAARRWVVENWERYWVPRDGCEAYVSFVILGDAADGQQAGYSGIALYEASNARRISFSVVPDGMRLLTDPGSPLGGPIGTFFDVGGSSEWRPVTYLFSHETGHLMGPHHPHNNQRPERVELRSLSSVWTPMSYQAGERTTEFGAIERTNWLRNRVGFALKDAHEAGRGGVDEALARVASQDWEGALAVLLSQR